MRNGRVSFLNGTTRRRGMDKKAKNRLLGALVLGFAVLALTLVALSYYQEQTRHQEKAQEDKELQQFFAWRDK